MTYTEYLRKRTWLLEVLRDAEERGDIYLEYDVKDQLSALEACYNEEAE
jgi:hypothetical protein